MKRFLIIIIALHLFLNLQAQTVYSEQARSYAEEGDYEEAIRLEKEGQEMLISVSGTDNSDYASSLNNIAMYNSFIGNYSEAIRLGTQAMEILKDVLGNKNPDYATFLSNLAIYNVYLDNYLEAIRLETQVIGILKEVLGENHPDYANSLSNLAYCYASMGNYSEALPFETKAMEIYRVVLGEKHHYYAISLSNLAGYNAELGNYSEAIRLETQAMVILKEVLGERHPNYALSLSNLAGYNAEFWNYYNAIRLGTQAMEIYKEVFGERHPDYATSLYNLARYNANFGNYSEAIRLETQALEIYREVLGEKHHYYAISLSNLAGYNAELGNYSEAIRLEIQAMEILKEVLGEKHPYYAISLSNLANYNAYQGNSIRVETQGKEIFKEVLGEKHTDYAHSLSNLANYNVRDSYPDVIRPGSHALEIRREFLSKEPSFYVTSQNNLTYSNIYNYSSAIRFETQAVEIYKEDFGDRNPDYATSLSKLAKYNAELGNYSEAIRLETQAMEILKEVLGEKHIDYARSLRDLSGYNADFGNYSEAIRLGTQAMEIYREVRSERHPNYALSLSNLSSYYADFGNYSEAIRLCTIAMEIRRDVLGERHPESASSLSNLANYYAKQGNYTEAIKFETKAMEIYKEVLGEKHPDYTSSLLLLIYLDNENLSKYSHIVSSNFMEEVKHNFKYLPQNMRSSFWDINKGWFENELPQFCYKTSQKEIIHQSYDGILLSKGLLLNSQIEFEKFLAETDSPVLQAKFNEVKDLRIKLNKLYEKPIANGSVDTDSLERLANELERQLLSESTEFGDYTRNLSITWEDVRDNLKDKEAAIEFVHFPLNNDSTMYMAYVLRPGIESPQMVKLFEEKDLTRLIDEDDKSVIYTDKSASQKVWGKLQPQLEGIENVYFAPDGVLHQIAIEYFPAPEGEGMISDRYKMHRLSSTREIAMNRHTSPSKTAVIYGGIQYDTDTATMIKESQKYEKPKHRGFNPYQNIGDSLAMRASLDYLEGSEKEAEQINGMMKKKKFNSRFLSKKEATEESFKSLSGKSNGIIHISTHGFYWTESEAERKARNNDRLMFMSQMGDNARRSVEDKALTRTGLFMAGAKNALGGSELPEDVDDGILTAQEIANLDLRGLDLVVLSACQTGMGDIRSDGVFGLQRGFKKAGANTILMSLWNVDDEATQILMTEFYKNYLNGMSKQQSLQAAQKTLRENPDYSDPKYWAAFILLDALN